MPIFHRIEKSIFIDYSIFLFSIIFLLIPGLEFLTILILLANVFRSEPQYIIQTIFFIGLIKLFNTQILDNGYLNKFQYIIVFLGFILAISITNWRRLEPNKILIIIFGLILFFHSIFFSKWVDVSLLKASSWFLTFFTLYSLWQNLKIHEQKKLLDFLLNLLFATSIIGLLIISQKHISYAINPELFQGIFSHPQITGIIAAFLAIFSLSKLLASGNLYSSWNLFNFLLMFFITYLTGSRTAMISILIILLLSVFTPLRSNKKFQEKSNFLSNKQIYIFLTLVLLSLLVLTGFFDLVISFVDKGGLNDQQNLFEKYKNSRYILIEPMIQNIRNYPYLGIGFGVSSYFDTWNPSYDSLLNIPISAVTEKGNFFLAVFEEIGLVGSIFFLIVLLNLTYTSLKASYEKSFIFLLILVINLSEYFLFSMGGIGLVSAVFLTYSISYPKL